MVRLPPADRVRALLHRRAGRDQPGAVRPARGGTRADRRVPHRVQRDAVRAVLPRRIRQHDRRLVGCDDAVSGRVAAAVPQRRLAVVSRHHPELGLVPPEVVLLPLCLHLGARDAASLSVRPADAPRLEGADPARDHQPGRDRDRESDTALMGEAIAFYTIAAFVLGFAVMVVSTKDTVHSVLFLVLDFLFVAALYVLLGAPFLAAIQILVYAGGIVVLYLFVVMLVNLKRPPEAHHDPHRRTKLGIGMSAAVLLELGAIAVYSSRLPATPIAP